MSGKKKNSSFVSICFSFFLAKIKGIVHPKPKIHPLSSQHCADGGEEFCDSLWW